MTPAPGPRAVWHHGPLVDDTNGNETQNDPGDDPQGDGRSPTVEQFQRAALEAVQAARAFLDAAESMIQEPAALEAVVDTVNAVVRQASEVVSGAVSDLAARGRDHARPTEGDDDGAGPDPGYQAIRIDE